MDKLKDILTDIQTICESTPNVNSYRHGNVDDVINLGDVRYSAILSVFENCQFDMLEDTAAYTFTLFYFDLDVDNTVDIQSHGTQVIFDILKELETKYRIGDVVTVRPFERRNAALASGVFAEFRIIVDNSNDCK